jgi:hypothetical protein
MTTVTVTDKWDDGQRFHVVGNVTFSGNYTTGGDLLSFSQYAIKSASPPIYADFNGQSQYNYNYIPPSAANIAAGVGSAYCGLKVLTPTSELPSGTYPAGVLADVVQFHAIFKKFQ